MNFSELTVEEFEEFCSDGAGNFLQSREMYQRYQDLGRESYLVGVKSDGGVLAAGLMAAKKWRFGKKVFRVAGGWVTDYEDKGCVQWLETLTTGAKEFVRGKGGIAIEVASVVEAQRRDLNNKIVQLEGGEADHRWVGEALTGMGYKYLGEYEQPKWVFVLELDAGEQQPVWEGFRQSHRRMVRKAEREGVVVREVREGELPEVMGIMRETGERQGFREPDVEYFRSIQGAFGDRVKLMVAEKEGVGMLTVGLFVLDHKEMIYLYGGSRRELQKYGGAYALQWEMIKEAIRRGYKRYNFYGTRPEEGNGVYQFKQGFRGRMEELLGTYMLPVGVPGKIYVGRLKPREFGEIR